MQKRVLPWRDCPSLYFVWVSEIMLQQTQVMTVIPYFERFIARFPNVEDLAQASEEEVLFYWSGLGYYSRARRLREGAIRICKRGSPSLPHFPTTRDEWLDIPGVGPYTAGAILSIALDQPEAILDGNVERVLCRWKGISSRTQEQVYKKKLWKLSSALVQEAYQLGIRPSVFNQALMELGATVCSPRNPNCQKCPCQSACKAFQEDQIDQCPPSKPRPVSVLVEEEVHAVFYQKKNQTFILLEQQNKGSWRAGLWDFLSAENFAQQNQKLKIKDLGHCKTRHVVTRHQITRTTYVWKVSGNPIIAHQKKWVLLKQDFSGLDAALATGSAFHKSLAEVRKSYSSFILAPSRAS